MKKRKRIIILICLAVFLCLGIILDIASTQRHMLTTWENEREVAKTENNTNQVPPFDHIFIIVMENRSYEEIVGNKKAPYINHLIQNGALAGNYYAITHPSLPNYTFRKLIFGTI